MKNRSMGNDWGLNEVDEDEVWLVFRGLALPWLKDPGAEANQPYGGASGTTQTRASLDIRRSSCNGKGKIASNQRVHFLQNRGVGQLLSALRLPFLCIEQVL